MFGAEYSRMKFWLISLLTYIVGTFFIVVAISVSEGAKAIVSIIVLLLLIHILANRIRGYGSNPWLALWSLIPLVGLFQAIYYGCKKSRKVPLKES